MMRSLHENWTLYFEPYGEFSVSLPASVYTTLLAEKKIPDPYYGLNESAVRELSRESAVFSTNFQLTVEECSREHLELRFGCIDTIASVYLNGKRLGKTDNMFARWDFDLKQAAHPGENCLRVEIASPVEYAEAAQDRYPLWGMEPTMAMRGYQHIRKAHCMFGWDWGPQLPDMGIYRDVTLLAWDGPRLENILVLQEHKKNGRVQLEVQCEFSDGKGYDGELRVSGPDGSCQTAPICGGIGELEIKEPQLWWPNGYGDHPLYTVTVDAGEKGSVTEKIGLRTLTVSNREDEWGNEFAFVVNGEKIFSMGADYIPEDNLIPRTNRERTAALIRSCVEANYNTVRIWGGGYYPEDWLYELCDENGLIIWQDFMFACAEYRVTDEFEATLRREFQHNIKRFRNHACLGLFCGNNEMELALLEWGVPKNETLWQDYIYLYERLLPRLVKQYAPQTFYWPASPSKGGGFNDPNSFDSGDVHYWEVWHGSKPFEEYRKYYFRYCSEFGFEAFPDMETLQTIGEKKDMNPFSRVMESHQKCDGGNKKILSYLADYYLYPKDFPTFVYASQLLQADAIKYGVEHFRRFRGRCMGAVYWQINDIWPGPSWASVDYYGRWKALHYAAKRFFAPVLLSAHLDGKQAVLNISNETRTQFWGQVKAGIRTVEGKELYHWEKVCCVAALSSRDVLTESLEMLPEEERYGCYFYCTLKNMEGQTISRDTVLLVKPKHFRFEDPALSFQLEETAGTVWVKVSAKRYARGVRLAAGELPVRFEDNYFDLHARETRKIKVIPTGEKGIDPEALEKNLTLVSVFDIA